MDENSRAHALFCTVGYVLLATTYGELGELLAVHSTNLTDDV